MKIIDILKEHAELDQSGQLKPKFNFQDLPFDQLEKVGLKKENLLSLSDTNIVALLSGSRTDLIRFSNLEANGNKFQPLDAKISLTRDQEGNVSLAFHPIVKVVANDYNLSQKEFSDLLSGNVQSVLKEVPIQHNKSDKIVIQYDKDLNSFVSESTRNISAPKSIAGVNLTEPQKKAFTEGEEIEVNKQKYNLSLKGALNVVGKIALFALDGGLTLIIMAIIKHERKKEEERKNAEKLLNQPAQQKGALTVSNTNFLSANADSNKAQAASIPKENHKGSTIIDFGSAHYEHDATNPVNYFVKIAAPSGEEKELWGVDLERAVSDSGVERGDKADIQFLGKKEVIVQQHKRDTEGKIIGVEPIHTHRNEWGINITSKNPVNLSQEEKVQATISR